MASHMMQGSCRGKKFQKNLAIFWIIIDKAAVVFNGLRMGQKKNPFSYEVCCWGKNESAKEAKETTEERDC